MTDPVGMRVISKGGRDMPEYDSRPGDWPLPEPLPQGMPDVPAFNYELLPNALAPWIKDIADRMQCPPDFPAVGAVTALASIIGRQCAVRPKNEDDWTVVPNLWGAIIGVPGLLKTPALAEVLKPIHRIEAAARKEHDEAVFGHEAEKMVAEASKKEAGKMIAKAIRDGNKETARQLAENAQADEKAAPERARFITSDVTVEKLGVLLAANPRGILTFRDELVGLLRQLDKEGQEGARAFYLEAWNGTGRYTYDRIGRGTIDIEAACVSVLGGIQPGPLISYLSGALKGGAGDDGLLQRFQLIVWPDVAKVWKDVDRSPDVAARRNAWDMFDRVNDLGDVGATSEEGEVPWLRFEPSASEIFASWRSDLENRLRSGKEHPAFEAHLSKYRSLIPSLALVYHLADCPEGGPVSKTALIAALAWGEYLEAHARRLYAPALDPDLTAARTLFLHISDGDLPDTFTARAIYRKCWQGLDRESTKGALEYLSDLSIVRGEATETNGRPTTVWHVNPRLAEGEQQ